MPALVKTQNASPCSIRISMAGRVSDVSNGLYTSVVKLNITCSVMPSDSGILPHLSAA